MSAMISPKYFCMCPSLNFSTTFSLLVRSLLLVEITDESEGHQVHRFPRFFVYENFDLAFEGAGDFGVEADVDHLFLLRVEDKCLPNEAERLGVLVPLDAAGAGAFGLRKEDVQGLLGLICKTDAGVAYLAELRGEVDRGLLN
jgi:hypothetical protein